MQAGFHLTVAAYRPMLLDLFVIATNEGITQLRCKFPFAVELLRAIRPVVLDSTLIHESFQTRNLPLLCEQPGIAYRKSCCVLL